MIVAYMVVGIVLVAVITAIVTGLLHLAGWLADHVGLWAAYCLIALVCGIAAGIGLWGQAGCP